MAREHVSYKQLGVRLETLGLDENAAQLRTKINRGTFSFVFFLQCLAALGHDEARFEVKRPPGWARQQGSGN